MTEARAVEKSTSWKNRGWTNSHTRPFRWDGYGKDHKTEGTRGRACRASWKASIPSALWWKPDEYVFYVDGKETCATNAGGVCQVPQFILLSDEIASGLGATSASPSCPTKSRWTTCAVHTAASSPHTPC